MKPDTVIESVNRALSRAVDREHQIMVLELVLAKSKEVFKTCNCGYCWRKR